MIRRVFLHCAHALRANVAGQR